MLPHSHTRVFGFTEFYGPSAKQAFEDGGTGRLDQEPGTRKAFQQVEPIALEIERAIDINRQPRGSGITVEIGQDIDQVPGSMGLCVTDRDELDVGRLCRGAESPDPPKSPGLSRSRAP